MHLIFINVQKNAKDVNKQLIMQIFLNTNVAMQQRPRILYRNGLIPSLPYNHGRPF
jgi:hypothetical protein